MLLSYFIGQRKAPIPYDLKRIGLYTMLTIGLLAVYYALRLYYISNMWLMMAAGTVLLLIYCGILIKLDFNVFRNSRGVNANR